jgi:hypothetical protein
MITDILWFIGKFPTNYKKIIICNALVSCIFFYGTGTNKGKQDPGPVRCFQEAESSDRKLSCPEWTFGHRNSCWQVIMMISRFPEFTRKKEHRQDAERIKTRTSIHRMYIVVRGVP